MKIDYGGVTVVLLSDFCTFCTFTMPEKRLIMKSSVYIWYSVICSGTHRQENLGVIATVSFLKSDNRKLYMGTPTTLLDLALSDSERSKSRSIRC